MNPKRIDINAALSFGWRTLTTHAGSLVPIALVYFIIMAAVSIMGGHMGATTSPSFVELLRRIVANLISIILGAGMIKVALAYIDGQEPTIGTFFSNSFPTVLRIFGASILIGIIVVAGLILFVIPGIYLAFMYSQTNYFIIEKGMGVFEAMSNSSRVTQGVKLQLFLFGIIGFVICVVGLIALLIGILPAVLVLVLAQAHIYRQLSVPTAEEPATSTGGQIVSGTVEGPKEDQAEPAAQA